MGVVPLLGAAALAAVAVKAYSYYSTAGNNYSHALLGIQTPILIGIGGLILGIILMFASWPFFHEYFSRKPFEAVDPALLEEELEDEPRDAPITAVPS
jgi:hypothetical protein